MSRRDVLRSGAALAGSCCLCAAPAPERRTCCITPEIEPDSVTFSEGKIRINLEIASSLRELHSSVNIIDTQRQLDLIVVHAADDSYRVLSGLCTHYPRPLTYIPSRGVLQCNNFNHSIFTLDGQVLKGPAPKPLRAYRTALRGAVLEVDV